MNNFLINLKTSWLESLKLFLPKNLKVFLLLGINTYMQFFSTIKNSCFKRFSGFKYILLLFFAFIFAVSSASSVWLYILAIIFIIPIRPSIEVKDFGLIFSRQSSSSQKRMVILLMIFGLLLYMLHYEIKFNYFGLFLLLTLFINIPLFILDSQNTWPEDFKAGFRGLKMFVYNLPFYFIIFNLFFWPIYYLNILLGYNIFFYILLLLVLPFYLCLVTNYYIKRIHEQFNLYFSAGKN